MQYKSEPNNHSMSKRTMLNLLLGISFCLVYDVSSQYAEKHCATPLGKNGTCKHLRQCDSLMAFIKNKTLNDRDTLRFLQKSRCGFDRFEPVVCCEKVPEISQRLEINLSPPNASTHPNIKLLPKEKCGIVFSNKMAKIDNGLVEIWDYPWTAIIFYNSTEIRCGGSIINKRYILTAAHCVTELPNRVRVGATNLSKPTNGEELVCGEYYQDLGIESIYSHPKYSKTKMQNDIALLRLDSDIDFTACFVARPICLPLINYKPLSSRKAEAVGWGISTKTKPKYTELRRVSTYIVKNDLCRKKYKGFKEIKHTQMCAKPNKKICIENSGGALHKITNNYYTQRHQEVQYGIMSFEDSKSSTERFPNVYTRVDYYMDWILDTIRE